jgi:hypothetical protein
MLECNEMNEGCAKKSCGRCFHLCLCHCRSRSSCLDVVAVFARSFGCLKLAPRAGRDSDISHKTKFQISLLNELLAIGVNNAMGQTMMTKETNR